MATNNTGTAGHEDEKIDVQGLKAALQKFKTGKLDGINRVIVEALHYLYKENAHLKALLTGDDSAVMPKLKAQVVEAEELLTLSTPQVLTVSTAGAPSASIVPDNWKEETMGVWYGCPRFVGQQYIDKVSKKVYIAVTLTNSTADWVALN